jgi:hypothetical protein
MPSKNSSKDGNGVKTRTGRAWQLGDRVEIRYYPDWRGRIVELRGPLGPGGAEIYRVRIPNKPKPKYVEVRGDQLIAIPAEE